ncbi:peroxynitrite isomerase THAP4-like [Cydia strobilella]|uniref:peroxynitrite isomerase THAP4-like n=1 Tax=Cydia strobilella TaxID=1100964 RepID=UPI003007D45E
MAAVEMPEALKPISWLAGRWKTESGCGKYPNIPEFQYHEVLEFTCIGQPMLNFTSTSRHPEKQTPMHQERGFLRIKPGSHQLAFIVSHNFGLTSLEEGQVEPEKQQVVLISTSISRMSFAKQPSVKSLKRVWKLLDPGTLEVTIYMETDDTPLTEHLKAVYTKESQE